MNLLLDFNRRELAVIGMAISAVHESTQQAEQVGMTPPDGLVEALESVITKFNTIVEARIASDDQFTSIVENLAELDVNLEDVEIQATDEDTTK
jgi:hypothetical protein